MMLIRFVPFFIFITFAVFESYGIPAYPRPVTIKGDDGENIVLLLKGDENLKYAVVENNGHTAIQDSLGVWRYLKEGAKGNLLSEISEFKVIQHGLNVDSFLRVTSKGLIPFTAAQTDISRSGRLNYREADPHRVVGERKALIILAQFTDCKFTCDKTDFENLFNQEGYTKNGATGSVYDYFNEVSEGQLTLSSTLIGPFTAKKQMSYYGRNTGLSGGDSNPYELFKEALEYAKNEINLKDYDCDGDGFIDNIHIIYAGYGEEAGASSNAIWAHESSFPEIEIYKDLKIDRYSCSPELRGNHGGIITTIGPPCHEICHALGAMDFYDTDYTTGGEYSGTSDWDVMGSGSWNNDGNTPAWPNAYVRTYNFGWTEPEILEDDGLYVFPDEGYKKIYRANTNRDNDYYLIEYRDKNGFSSAEPGSGIVMFHIGPDIESRSISNTINASFPQQCYPVCASSTYKIPQKNSRSYGDVGTAGCPFPGTSDNRSFSSETTPAACSIDGLAVSFSITEIDVDDTPSFMFSRSGDDSEISGDDDCLWIERFDSVSTFSEWTQNSTRGKASWSIMSEEDEDLQNNYVSLSPLSGYLNPRVVKIDLESPSFTLNINDRVVDKDLIEKSVDCNVDIEFRNTMSSTVRCVLKIIDGFFSVNSAVFDVESCSEWIHKKINLITPLPTESRLKLVLETEFQVSEGEFNMDNIKILPVKTVQSSLPTVYPDEKGYDVYDMMGNKVKCNDWMMLPRGFYIIRSLDGSSVEKFVKN